jgi:hypothetical protein
VRGEHADALVQVGVCGGPADRVVGGQLLTPVLSGNQRRTRTACPKQPRVRMPVRVPRRSRSACSRCDTNRTVCSRTVKVAVYVSLIRRRAPHEADLGRTTFIPGVLRLYARRSALACPGHAISYSPLTNCYAERLSDHQSGRVTLSLADE